MKLKTLFFLLITLALSLSFKIATKAQTDNIDVKYDRFTDTTTVATKSLKILDGKEAENWGQLYVQMYSGYVVKGQYGNKPNKILVNFESYGFRTFIKAVSDLNLIVDGQRISLPMSHRSLESKCCNELGQVAFSFEDYQLLTNASTVELQLGRVELKLKPSDIELLRKLTANLSNTSGSASLTNSTNANSSNELKPQATNLTGAKNSSSNNEDKLSGKWRFVVTVDNQTTDITIIFVKIDNIFYYGIVTDLDDTSLTPIEIQNGNFLIDSYHITKDNQVVLARFKTDLITHNSIKGKFYSKLGNIEGSTGEFTGVKLP